MTERDPLTEVLREWIAAEPSPALDNRILTAYRRASQPLWKRVWSTKVSVPLPAVVFAAMLLFVLAIWYRSTLPQPASGQGGIVTQLDTAGFQAVRNGEARVITVKDLRQ